MQKLHWHWADPVASVAIAALIVVAVRPLLQQSAAQLLERTPAPRLHSSLAFTLEEPIEPVHRHQEDPAVCQHTRVAQDVQQSAHVPKSAAQPRVASLSQEAEAIRRSPRKPGGQPAWLSDMVA